MRFLSLISIPVVALMLGGCASDPAPEEQTAATDQDLNAGDVVDIFCTFAHCENDSDHGSGGRWVKLGEERISNPWDHGGFDVRDGRRYEQLQLRVRDDDVRITDFRVHFCNGDRWQPDFDHRYREGDWSRTEYTPNGPRQICGIDIDAGNNIGATAATIEVWAHR